jgi:hypothetical protein
VSTGVGFEARATAWRAWRDQRIAAHFPARPWADEIEAAIDVIGEQPRNLVE